MIVGAGHHHRRHGRLASRRDDGREHGGCGVPLERGEGLRRRAQQRLHRERRVRERRGRGRELPDLEGRRRDLGRRHQHGEALLAQRADGTEGGELRHQLLAEVGNHLLRARHGVVAAPSPIRVHLTEPRTHPLDAGKHEPPYRPLLVGRRARAYLAHGLLSQSLRGGGVPEGGGARHRVDVEESRRQQSVHIVRVDLALIKRGARTALRPAAPPPAAPPRPRLRGRRRGLALGSELRSELRSELLGSDRVLSGAGLVRGDGGAAGRAAGEQVREFERREDVDELVAVGASHRKVPHVLRAHRRERDGGARPLVPTEVGGVDLRGAGPAAGRWIEEVERHVVIQTAAVREELLPHVLPDELLGLGLCELRGTARACAERWRGLEGREGEERERTVRSRWGARACRRNEAPLRGRGRRESPMGCGRGLFTRCERCQAGAAFLLTSCIGGSSPASPAGAASSAPSSSDIGLSDGADGSPIESGRLSMTRHLPLVVEHPV